MPRVDMGLILILPYQNHNLYILVVKNFACSVVIWNDTYSG